MPLPRLSLSKIKTNGAPGRISKVFRYPSDQAALLHLLDGPCHQLYALVHVLVQAPFRCDLEEVERGPARLVVAPDERMVAFRYGIASVCLLANLEEPLRCQLSWSDLGAYYCTAVDVS